MILTTIVFILILSLLVLVHEFGHFIVARKMGVKVDEFGLGFPPRAFGIYKGKEGKWIKVIGNKEIFDIPTTLYSLNWFPLGGFVKIKGENGEEASDQDSFANKKIWKRISIISAGVTMNFILAGLLLSLGFMSGLPQVLDEGTKTLTVKDSQIQIVEILDNSPAAEAGLKLGDVVISIGGKNVFNIDDVNVIISKSEGSEISLILKRGDETVNSKITPRKLTDQSEALMGVSLVKTGIVSYPWYKAIYMGFVTAGQLLKAIIIAFYSIIRDLIIGTPVDTDIAGPVGIAVLTGQVVNMGFVYVLEFAALLSLNLAIINFLPIPALDGGRVVFLVLEKIRGRAINARIENMIHTIGFALLMLLVVLVTFHDVLKFSGAFAGLWGKVKGFF